MPRRGSTSIFDTTLELEKVKIHKVLYRIADMRLAVDGVVAAITEDVQWLGDKRKFTFGRGSEENKARAFLCNAAVTGLQNSNSTLVADFDEDIHAKFEHNAILEVGKFTNVLKNEIFWTVVIKVGQERDDERVHEFRLFSAGETVHR